MLEIRTFTGSGFAENAYLIWQQGSGVALAIDPGADAAAMLDTLAQQQLQLEAILLTHAHIDHIEGISALKRAHPVPIHMHPGDALLYDHAAAQAAQFGMRVEPLPPVDKPLTDGESLHLAGIELGVRHVPGHSPGHVLFYAAEAGAAFVGDVVFQNSIGRTDLPGGNYQQLMSSIREHVMTLPPETKLYSGHGPMTTVQEERTFNPFIAPMYGGSFA